MSMALTERAKKILGKNCVKRFNEFNSLYTDAIEYDSVITLERFLLIFEKYSKNIEFSLFLSDYGNLILEWYDEIENLISIEFCKGYIEYYLETPYKEGYIIFNEHEIEKFIQSINSL